MFSAPATRLLAPPGDHADVHYNNGSHDDADDHFDHDHQDWIFVSRCARISIDLAE